VILSLEMHCSPRQQNRLAKMMVEHIGSALLTYDELVATHRAASLSPTDLGRRVLVKGKVKELEKGDGLTRRWSTKRWTCLTAPSEKQQQGLDTDSFNNERSETATCRRMSEEHISAEKARRKLYGRRKSLVAMMEESNSGSVMRFTDPFYASYLSLRALPLSAMRSSQTKWALPITSMNEDRLLKELGVSDVVRNQIEGLTAKASSSSRTNGVALTDDKQALVASVRLAANPPPEVGTMQHRTAKWMIRPYPLGLRFSGKNMNPLPFWLGGAQNVALNFSINDLAVQLHFALFNGSEGYVIKPPEMRAAGTDCWPPHREMLHRTTIEILSLHTLPKRGERRPRYDGSRVACHEYLPELSGANAPPCTSMDLSTPAISLSLHPIGGFCAVSDKLPLSLAVETDIVVTPDKVAPNAVRKLSCTLRAGKAETNAVNQRVHCIAAEPHATIFRIGVIDGGREVAYETAVLGRLRCGYRVFQLRSPLGTRIELCYLLVHVYFGIELNLWASPIHQEKQLRRRNSVMIEKQKLQERVEQLEAAASLALGESSSSVNLRNLVLGESSSSVSLRSPSLRSPG